MAKHCYRIHLVRTSKSEETLFACIGGREMTKAFWQDLLNSKDKPMLFAARLSRLPKRYVITFYKELEFHSDALIILENLRCTVPGIICHDSTGSRRKRNGD